MSKVLIRNSICLSLKMFRDFCLPIFVLFLFLFCWCLFFSVLFLVAVISLPPHVFVFFLVAIWMLSWMLAIPFPPYFLGTHSLSTSSLMVSLLSWTLTKRLEKKLDGKYTRTLRAILNKSWRQHPTRHQLYGHLPPITKTIQVRRTRHAGHCWRSRDELISDVLIWTPTYGRAKAGRQARTYIQQLFEDMGCSPEDLQEAMNNREKWRERVRDIHASGTTWWWWWRHLWDVRAYAVSSVFLISGPFVEVLLWSNLRMVPSILWG